MATDPLKLKFFRALLLDVTLVFAAIVALGCGPMAGPAPQPMELRGEWLGVRVTSADSPTAAQFGVTPTTPGVVVAEVLQGSRALQGGLVPGDVIMSVDGTNIVTLSELYTLTTKLDTARALPIDIVRRGQPLRLVMPPPAGMAAPGMVPPGMVPPGMVPPGMVPPGMAAPDMAAPGMAAPGMAALGMAAPGVGMPQPMNAPSAMGGAPGSKMCPHCGGALAP